jgi:hypothetical protein
LLLILTGAGAFFLLVISYLLRVGRAPSA